MAQQNKPKSGKVFCAVAIALAAVAVAAGDMAYVTNQNSSDLSILDLDAKREVVRLPVEGKPAGVAIGPDRTIFVVSPGDKTVRRIHTQSGRVEAQARLDGGPIGVAYAPGIEEVFVSDWYNARIWVLDATSLGVRAMLETSSAPAGLAVHGNMLASADKDANQVSIFDLQAHTLIHRILVGEHPFGLAFAPDGRLFAGNVGADSVSVIDPVYGRTLATLPVGERPYGIAFAQGRAFVSNQYAGTVHVVDLAALTPIATIAVGEYPEGIDATTNGSTIVVANWFSNTVTLIDAETLSVSGEIETGDGPRAFGRFVAAQEE